MAILQDTHTSDNLNGLYDGNWAGIGFSRKQTVKLSFSVVITKYLGLNEF